MAATVTQSFLRGRFEQHFVAKAVQFGDSDARYAAGSVFLSRRGPSERKAGNSTVKFIDVVVSGNEAPESCLKRKNTRNIVAPALRNNIHHVTLPTSSRYALASVELFSWTSTTVKRCRHTQAH